MMGNQSHKTFIKLVPERESESVIKELEGLISQENFLLMSHFLPQGSLGVGAGQSGSELPLTLPQV